MHISKTHARLSNMATNDRFYSIPMPNVKTISEIGVCLQYALETGFVIVTHFDCMLTSGKPVFKAYQCHIIISTKLTIPLRTEDFV